MSWPCVQSSKRHSSKKKSSSAHKSSKESSDSASELPQLVAQVPSSDFDLAQFVVAMGVIRSELRYTAAYLPTVYTRLMQRSHMFSVKSK